MTDAFVPLDQRTRTKKQAKVDQMERDYRAGKLQFANRPYSYAKATPPPIPDKHK